LPILAVRIRFRFAPEGILEVRIPFAPPTSLRLRGSLSRGASWPRISRPFAGFWPGGLAHPSGDAWAPRPNSPLAPIVSTADSGGSDSPENRFARGPAREQVQGCHTRHTDV